MSEVRELISLCKGKKIYIQTHNFPDPDAIASAYGLQKLLQLCGIACQICYAGRIDRLSASKMLTELGIEMLSYDQLCGSMSDTDWIICVDSQKNGGNITDFVGEEMACIDHHPVCAEVSYRYWDIRSTGACATIIAEYYRQMGFTPDENTATALLYGLKMDTLQFSRGVTAADIDIFAFLHPLRNQKKLTALESNNLEMRDLKAYGAAVENIELYDSVGISHIPFSCPDSMIAVLADFILSLREVEVAVVSSAREDGLKLSVRSETDSVHAGELVRRSLAGLGEGGGHGAMAGGLVRYSGEPAPYLREQVRERLLQGVEEARRESWLRADKGNDFPAEKCD